MTHCLKIAALLAACLFSQHAAAQCLPPATYRSTESMKSEIARIDCELKGRQVCVQRALLPRNRVYATVLPSPQRRAELLANRDALEFRLSTRRSLLKGFILGFQIGMMNDMILRDLNRETAKRPLPAGSLLKELDGK